MLVLLALGAAAFFFFKVRRYLPERARGAELAPAETIFFAQFPNLRQTALRVPKSDLYQIWLEPDMQTFLEKPRRKAPWMRAWAERIDEILRAAPGECFVAVTSFADPRPSFVGGFSFAGNQRDAEALAIHFRAQVFSQVQIVSAFRSNWYLCASDSEMLAALLARFESKAGEALAATPIFQQSMAPLGVGQDLVLFGKPNALSGNRDFLKELGAPARTSADDVIALATKIDGAKMHDTIFLRGSGAASAGTLSRQTLPLASAQTLLYYASELSLLQPGGDLGMLKGLVPGLAGMEKSLAEKGLTWSDLPAAIGPEFGVMAEWPEDAVLPVVLLASEVRDAVKTRTFMDALTNPPPPNSPWQREQRDGVTIMTAPAQGLSFVRPSAALTDRFALLGMSPEAVTAALSNTGKSAQPSLGQAVAFQDIARLVPDRASAFGYLDFPRLFERAYRMARPFITLSLAFSANAAAQIDAGKLPPVEAISKHLGATVLTQTRIDGGTVIESIGSVTLPELFLAIGAGGNAAGLPSLAGALPGGTNKLAPQKPPRQPSSPIGVGGAAENSAPSPSIPEKTRPQH